MKNYLGGIKINTLRRDLSLRLTLLLSVFVIMLLVIYFVSSMAISAKEDDGVLINIAGQQNMLIQRYASEINQVLVGLAVSDFEMVLAEKKKADLTANLFEKIHKGFVNGGEVYFDSNDAKGQGADHVQKLYKGRIDFPIIKNPEILGHLKHVGEEWHKLKRFTLLSLRSNAQSITKSRYVRQLLAQAANTSVEMSYVVQLMQHDSENKLRRIDSIFVVMAIIGLAISLLIVYFVHTRIVVPLDTSVKALNDSKETLEIEKRRAEKASQAKSDFLSSMSHELRTPMNAILGFTQLLEFDKSLNSNQKSNMNEILRAGHHLNDLINDVLDLARVESGKIDLSNEPVNISELVTECFLLVDPLASNLKITISHEDMDDYFVHADRTRLKQVLINLLSNAIKYNREHGKVKLEAHPISDEELRITVSDTGIGIAEANLEELFEPFNRLDAKDGEVEGTGIGLTITRQLVEMMGGRIGVDSEPGIGSQFWLELPLESSVQSEGQENAAGMGENSASASDASSIEQERQYTVLYIEDNPANLRLVCKMLADRQDINLLTAEEPRLGLELASEHHPDLILMDITMPHMDGYQVLSILKADEQLQHIPVVAVTANAMVKDIARGKSADFSDYLTKPLDVPHFLATVDHFLT
jgi:signal transduction histidine kinase